MSGGDSTKALKDRITVIKEQKDAQIEAIESLGNLSKAEKEQAKAAVESAASSNIATESMAGIGTAAKTASVGTKVLSVALKTLGSVFAMLAIQIAVEKLYEFATAQERLSESVEETRSKYKELLSQYNDEKTFVEDNAERYAELSKGVNNLGENVSLTTEEYKEYNSIVSEIANKFPELITGYNSESQAILSLKGNVEALRDAYRETQEEAYKTLIANAENGTNGEDLIRTYQNELYGVQGAFWGTFSNYDYDAIGAEIKENYLTQIRDAAIAGEKELNNLRQRMFDLSRVSTDADIANFRAVFEEVTGQSLIGINIDFTEEELEQIASTAESYRQTELANIDTVISKIEELGNAYLNLDDTYSNLSSDAQNAASILVNNLDRNIVPQLDSPRDLGNYVNNIVSAISSSKTVQDELSNVMNFDFSLSDKTVSNAAKELENSIYKIAETTGIDSEHLKEVFGLNEVFDLDDNIQKVVDDFDLSGAEQQFINLNIKSQDQLAAWVDICKNISDAEQRMSAFNSRLAEANQMTLTDIDSNLNKYKTGIEAINTALSEQDANGTIASETLDTLRESYENIDSVLERTATGYRLNRDELQKLNDQEKENLRTDIEDKYKELTDQYNLQSTELAILNTKLRQADSSNQNYIDTLREQISVKEADLDLTASQIADLDYLAAGYDNVTSAYNEFVNALSTSNQGASYDNIVSQIENMKKLYEQGDIGADELQKFIQLGTSTDLSGMNASQIAEFWNESLKSINRYFTEDNIGLQNAYNDLKELGNITEDADGNVKILIDDLDETADKLNLDTSSLQSILEKLELKGFTINFEGFSSEITDTNAALEDLYGQLAALEGRRIVLADKGADTTEIDKQIAQIKESIDKIEVEIDPYVNIDEAAQEILRLQELIEDQKRVNLSAGVSNESDQVLQSYIQKQQQIANENGIDLEVLLSTNAAKTEIDTLNEKADDFAEKLSEPYTLDLNIIGSDKIAVLKSRLNDVIAQINKINNTSIDVNIPSVAPQESNSSKRLSKQLPGFYTGSAYANGNYGNWQVGVSGKALVGELGRELVVRNGRYFTVGENGAEFVSLKSDDIVFNNQQTEDLLSKGKINSRGKSFAAGSVKTSIRGTGSASKSVVDRLFSSGSAKEAEKVAKESDKAAKNAEKIADASSKTAKSTSETAENAEEIFDWMEQKIDVLDKKIEKLQNDTDILIGYKNKNKNVNTTIDVEIEKLDVLRQMYERYMQEANSVGLSQEYVNKVQNGLIDIEKISDEALADMINNYSDWYDKAVDVEEQIVSTQQEIKELNLSKLDNIVNQYEQILDIQNQMIDTEEQLIDLRTQAGAVAIPEDYIQLSKQQVQLVWQNKNAFDALNREMQEQNLQEGTEEWKEYNDQLEQYKSNMIEAAQAVENYKDEIVEFVYKDLTDFSSAVDSLNGTIDTLSGLIGDSGLIDDLGKLTDRGMAQVALYAQQMAMAKQEAAEYDEAIESLEDALDSGLITQDEYNDRLYDYISSQNSAVEAAKSAKDAIIDLVKQGIQAEIDAKKELIDANKEALDTEKDLHDYQNSIAEKQDNISKLERQIAALANSTSREDLAQRLQLQQQLKEAQEDLYETQYDHEIEQRKEALDEQYEMYEEKKQEEMDSLDTNLDAQEAAINEYLEKIKVDYSTVYGILKQYGEEYNLSNTEDITNPWKSGSEAANLCADAMKDAIANINYEISNIDISPLYELIDALNSIGYGNANGNYFEDISGTGHWQKGQGNRWWYGETYDPNGNYDYASSGIYTIDGKQYAFDDEGYMISGWYDDNGKWRYFETDNDGGEMVKSAWRRHSDGNWYYLDKNGVMTTNAVIKNADGSGWYYVDENGVWDGRTLTDEEKKSLRVREAFRKGTRNASSGIHLMDEDGIGSEAIITNRGTLKQFDGGEHVFNSEMTKRLWEFANNPSNFIDKTVANSIDFSKLKPIQSAIEFNAPLFQISGGLSSDLVGYVDDKCNWLKNNIGKIAYKDLKNTMLGK